MEKKDFLALTGIRFIAASLVFVRHYVQIAYTGKPPDFAFYFLWQMNVGVNLFFVLSGFLITHRYYAHSFGKGGFRPYWLKRFARIFPLYFAVLMFYFLLFYWQHRRFPDATTVVLNVTLLKGLSENYFLSGVSQAWSLTVEEMFYLYAPLAFYLIKNRGVFLLQIPLLFAAGFLLVGLGHSMKWPDFFGGSHFLLTYTFFGRCFEFFAGMFVALLIRKNAGEKSGIGFTAGGGLACTVFLCSLAFYAWRESTEDINGHLVGVLLFNLFIPASFALLIYGLVKERSWFRNLLATRPLTLLGKSSYAFYLLHIGFVAEVLYFHVTANLLLLYGLLQLSSIAAYKLFEKPVYFYLLRKFAVSGSRA